jgi:threonine/homoserine/homoserine lactone efflux protein
MLSMSGTVLFVLGTTVVLIMPGPTNTLLVAAGLQQGVNRAARLAGAELVGYVLSISVWGGFLTHVAQSLTWLPILVRVASCLYIAYLAIRIWLTAAASQASPQTAIGLRTVFVATLLNPKAILFAGTIFPAAAFVDWQSYLDSMGIFAALLISIGLAWIAFGAALGSGRLTWISTEGVQRCASIVLGMFSVSLAWSLFH